MHAYLWCFGLYKYGVVDPVDGEVDDFNYMLSNIVRIAWFLLIFRIRGQHLLCF